MKLNQFFTKNNCYFAAGNIICESHQANENYKSENSRSDFNLKFN